MTQALRRNFLTGALALGGSGIAARAAEAKPHAGFFDVTAHGAAGDGQHLNTRALQAAIDACAAGGGGTVYFPPGRYLSGTLSLKSHVTLHLEAGATLAGSPSLPDYPSMIPKLRSYGDIYTERSLLYAEKLENIAIQGRGSIDGQGAAFHGAHKLRPFLIRLVECSGVSIRDVRLRDAAMWVLHMVACDDVAIDGATIHSRVQRNNDGIDVDSCRRVRISNCDISTIDDNIVLKSCTDRPCQDIAVTNCVLSSDCSALKLGTESNGGFENIAFSNCTIYDTHVAGIDLLLVDGGLMERVAISNITMKNVDLPIFIRLGDRGRPVIAGSPRPGVGVMRNLRISQVEAVGANSGGCLISGIPERAIEDLSLDGIRIRFTGGGSRTDAARTVPELPDVYPTPSSFGVLPAYGFYCRHVKGLRLRDVELRSERPDFRPALICEDVEGMSMNGCSLAGHREAGPPLLFRDVRNALVAGCHVPVEAPAFLGLSGARTRKISLLANDFSGARQAVASSPDVSQEALFLAANRT
jgi:hypothetical protein